MAVLSLMARLGSNEPIELRAEMAELIEGFDPDQALANIGEIGVHYQPAADSGAGTSRRRTRRNRSWQTQELTQGEGRRGP